MSRYLIEVVHASKGDTEHRIAEAIRTLGSHFVTRATWTHVNDNCIGQLVVETSSRSEALGIVPPNLRGSTKVFRLEAA